MTQTVKYEKSAWRVWLVAVAGVPFLLIGADLFFEQKLVGAFGDLIYGAEELPAFEPRDTIVAALFLIGGLTLTLWGLKELVFPRKALLADREGLHLAVDGPFRPAVLIPWDALDDLEYEVIEDEGDTSPGLRLAVADWAPLPDNPWGARRASESEIVVDVTGWSPPADDIVERIWQLRQSLASGQVEVEEE
jgi:hypothetical protein